MASAVKVQHCEVHHLNRLVFSLIFAQPLFDPSYGLSIQAVKLKRNVEMYQWVEYEDSK